MLILGTVVARSADAELVVCSEKLFSGGVGSSGFVGAAAVVAVTAFSVLDSVTAVDVSAAGEIVFCSEELSTVVENSSDVVDASVVSAVAS